MTKNRSMRIAVLVLALALITCCFVGTTFAKYTSQATGSAAVTIAKWDFSGDVILPDDGSAGSLAAQLSLVETRFDSNGTDLETDVADGKIAPGTKGAGVIEITNASEVTSKFKASVNTTNISFLNITYTVKVGDGAAQPIEAAALANTGVDVPAGQSIALTISWDWPFEVGTDDDLIANDKDDTILGLTADGTALTAPITLTFTQVD